MRGRISRYFPKRGFGFIEAADAGLDQVFFHVKLMRQSGILEEDIAEGLWLEFDTRPSPNAGPNDRPEAVNIKPLSENETRQELEWLSRGQGEPTEADNGVG